MSAASDLLSALGWQQERAGAFRRGDRLIVIAGNSVADFHQYDDPADLDIEIDRVLGDGRQWVADAHSPDFSSYSFQADGATLVVSRSDRKVHTISTCSSDDELLSLLREMTR